MSHPWKVREGIRQEYDSAMELAGNFQNGRARAGKS